MSGGLLRALFGRWRQDEADVPATWQEDADHAWLEQQPLRARGLLYVIALVVLALIVWSAIATVDEVTRGQGQVIPSRQVQVVQSQDGGSVSEILVREGDRVKEGDLLLRLDPTRSRATLRENQVEYQALAVRAARLRAIAEGREFEPEAEFETSVPDIVARERALFESSRAELAAEKEIAQQQLQQRHNELREMRARETQLRRSLSLAREELDVTRPMVDSGAVSRVEILRLEREVNQLNGEREQALARIDRLEAAIEEAQQRLTDVELKFLNAVREKMGETLSRMHALQEVETGLSDRLEQTEVRSPVNGTIKQLFFNTVGGVVLPGREIAEIVPADDTLLVEVKIRPQDIAFLVPGQEALVKFTAYDFVVYGGLQGHVEQIGADTVRDEDGNPYYNVRVRTGKSSLGEDMPVISGMTVVVDILTGKKTILAYLMKPILRARQYALTER